MNVRYVFAVAAMLGLAACAVDADAPVRVDSAIVMCNYFAKQTLARPATVQYPGNDTAKVTATSANRFKVVSYINARNEFGVLHRVSYTCVTSTKDGQTWVKESLTTH